MRPLIRESIKFLPNATKSRDNFPFIERPKVILFPKGGIFSFLIYTDVALIQAVLTPNKNGSEKLALYNDFSFLAFSSLFVKSSSKFI